VLVCIAHDPGIRLREIAASVGITERSAFAIVSDLADAGYVVKQRDGRRNRYQVQTHLRLPDAVTRAPTIGEILDLLVDTDRRERQTKPAAPRARARPARKAVTSDS
jgi:hypothetical protein